MTSRPRLSNIEKQVVWDRLIAIVEEQAQTLQRTAFSTIVRESGDLAAGVFDRKGRMLAQAVTGTPGHINTMALNVGHVLDRFPIETLADGDVIITNDPWLGTGHTNDFCITTPVFRHGAAIGLFACNCHLMDIGGVLGMAASTDLYMEGLLIPMLKLVEAGEINATLMALITANTRLPVETEGDVYAMISCNAVGTAGLLRMMDEFDLESLDDAADYIIDVSRKAVLKNIDALPKGTWHNEMTLDGYDEPILLKAAMTISEAGINVDFTGSSMMVPRNINVPICYTLAYTAFGIACIVSPQIPNNAGSLEPVTVSSPPGTIVNALKPAAVVARHIVGLMMPDLVFGCLRQVVPDRVPAEGAGVLWGIRAYGPWTTPAEHNNNYRVGMITTGGMGALPYRDGLSATGYPSGVRGAPVEIFEQMSTLILWKKEYRTDSGGAGTYRGGLGQSIEVANLLPEPFTYFNSYERMKFAPRGVDGGHNGAVGTVRLSTGESLSGKGSHVIRKGARLLIDSPGGGGIGHPAKRSPDALKRDIEHEYVSAEQAVQVYGLSTEFAEKPARKLA
jgi:N-methylhydantoinase B